MLRARIRTKRTTAADGVGVLADLNGMSGGPSITVAETDFGARISLLAIQSEFDEASGVVAACYLHPFLAVLERERVESLKASEPS